MLSRRTFLKGLVATAAGILVPLDVAAEPERRIWALDSTMMAPTHTDFGDIPARINAEPVFGHELVWIQEFDPRSGEATVVRGLGGTAQQPQSLDRLAHSLATGMHASVQPGDFVMVGPNGAQPLGVHGPVTPFSERVAGIVSTAL